jgi:hypothetical protein
MRFAWLTHGKVTCDGIKTHDDLLAEFPYLGPPNPLAARAGLLRADDAGRHPSPARGSATTGRSTT